MLGQVCPTERHVSIGHAISIALSIVTPSTAQADEPGVQYTNLNGKCESGEVCVYRLAEYSGGVFDTGSDDKYYNNNTFYGTNYNVDNRASSIKNTNLSRKATFYQLSNYGGWGMTVWGLTSVSNIATNPNWGSAYDNRISSHQFHL
ncbi:peptidase inhibitor family I36 protein [Stackebrandtia endophytica]|uniref:peptidase inhibitor family I36 protein n=1 Tax=Stackebrandtia endophytica TaxID=1496996 RepID=UPI001151746C|nr:peptidase inhibitor family I36 protein [Stackebrandtia endophytica]